MSWPYDLAPDSRLGSQPDPTHPLTDNAGDVTSITIMRHAADLRYGMPFQPGDRVRLSELGRERSPRIPRTVGIVVSRAKGGRVYFVLMDGAKTPTRLHETYLELMED